MPRLARPVNAPLRYLALGDSYTIGEGVPAGARWPVQLAAALTGRGLAIEAPRIIATTGWTTDELSAALDAALAGGELQPPYDLVSLLVGVNDQYRGRPVADFAPRFDALLARAIGFAGDDPDKVLALSIPDWGTSPFAAASGRDRAGIAAEIDAYNAAAAASCQRRGVAWVDVTTAGRDPAGAAMLVADGLHPSAEMYGLWTRAALAACQA